MYPPFSSLTISRSDIIDSVACEAAAGNFVALLGLVMEDGA